MTWKCHHMGNIKVIFMLHVSDVATDDLLLLLFKSSEVFSFVFY